MKITKLTLNGNDYALLGAEQDAHEIFVKQPYKPLNVKGKVVYDVGSSVGDTAVYFLSRGAEAVIGYESDKERDELAWKNKQFNNMTWFFPNHVKLTKLNISCEHENAVMKMDIEGGEYDVILNALKDRLRQFEEIILEFHEGDKMLVEKLKASGFKVKITHRSILNPGFGIMHAIREKEVELVDGKYIEKRGIDRKAREAMKND